MHSRSVFLGDDINMVKKEFRETQDTTSIPVGSLTKSKLDSKDPLRLKRKKARRACFSCQRAHLTCGMLLNLALFKDHLCQPFVAVVNSSPDR